MERLQVRVHPAPASDGDLLTGQRGQARALGQCHHRHQARPRNEIRVIKTTRGPWPAHATIALDRCSFGPGDGSVSNSHRPWSRGTFRVDAPPPQPPFAQWIEAKLIFVLMRLAADRQPELLQLGRLARSR